MQNQTYDIQKLYPWNKGKLIGQKAPLKQQEVCPSAGGKCRALVSAMGAKADNKDKKPVSPLTTQLQSFNLTVANGRIGTKAVIG